MVSQGEYLHLLTLLDALKKHCQHVGLSLADVAARSRMDPSAVSRLENGVCLNPTLDTLYRYAQAFPVSNRLHHRHQVIERARNEKDHPGTAGANRDDRIVSAQACPAETGVDKSEEEREHGGDSRPQEDGSIVELKPIPWVPGTQYRTIASAARIM